MSDPLESLALPHDPEMPNAQFAARLKARVQAVEARDERAQDSTNERDHTMTTRLIPYLSVTDSRAAMQFYAEVFDAQPFGELVEMDDGRIGHAMMTIGDELIYMADEFPEMNILSPTTRGGGTIAMVINVDDCDAVYQHALDAGATAERPPSDAHGQRSGWFVDPWGHRWSPTSAGTQG